jgi:hypothetical protein
VTMTEGGGRINGHGPPRNRSGHHEKINDEGHTRMKAEESALPVQELPVRHDKTAETKDMTDEMREKIESHGHDHKVPMSYMTPSYIDPPPKYNRERTVVLKSKKEDKTPVDQKPAPKSQPAPTAVKAAPITASSLLDEDDPPLSKVLGFSRFSTTKGKKHEDYGGVEQTVKTRKYRQYMNRPGGFNRPLD